MNRIKTLILDFDGTLGNTTEVIVRTMHAAIHELGLPARTDAECAATIGLKLIEIPPVLFPGLEVDPNLFAATYRRFFHTFNSDGAVKLYPGVKETLMDLHRHGFTLTIASSRSHITLDEYIRKLGLSEIISHVVGGEDVKEGKPNPEAVNIILNKLGISADEALVVGDTSFDIDMGRNAGTMTCGVTYGNGTRESMAQADWLIDEFCGLTKLIPYFDTANFRL